MTNITNNARRIRNRAVHTWIRAARSAHSKDAAKRAWNNALAIADRHGATGCGWIVKTSAFGHNAKLVEITRVTSRGTVYGRVHYRSRNAGNERNVRAI